MAQNVATLQAKLTANTGGFISSIKRAQGALSGMGRGFKMLSMAASPLKMMGGLLGSLAGGLMRVGQIAAGIVLAQVFMAATQALAALVRKAFEATETMQRLGIQIQTLSAREMQRNINASIEQSIIWRKMSKDGELLMFDVKALTAALGDNAAQIMELNPELKSIIQSEKNFAAVTTDVRKKWISTTDVFEQAGERAREMINKLKRIAIISPFTVATTNTMFRLGSAMGFTSDEAITVTKGMLDVAAGLGLTEESARRLMLNFSQIRSQSKLTQRDIREMSLTGFQMSEVFEEMNRTLGTNIKTNLDFNEALKSSQFTWEEFVNAFASMADREFGDSARRMAFTIGGLKSTFEDVFLVTLPSILIPAAEVFGEFAQEAVNKLLEVVESGKLEELGQQIADKVRAGLTTAGAIIDLAGMLPDVMELPGIEGFAGALEFLDGLAKFEDVDLTMFMSFAESLDETVTKVNNIKQFFSDAKDHVVLIGQIMSDIPVMESLKQEVPEAKTGILDGIKEAFEEIDFKMIEAAILTLSVVIAANLHSAILTITPFVEDFLDALEGVNLGPILAIAGALIQLAIGLTVGLITGGLRLATSFIEGLKDIWEGAATIIEGIGELIGGDTGGFTTMLEGLALVTSGLVEALSGGLIGFITGAAEGVLTFFAGLLTDLGASVPEWLQQGIDFAQGLWDGFKSKIEEVQTEGPAKLEEIATAIQEKVDEFKTAGENLIKGLADGMVAEFNRRIDKLKAIAQQVIDLFNSVFGNNSPSTVMFDVGTNVAAGFEAGVSAHDVIAGSIARMGSTVTGTITAAPRSKQTGATGLTSITQTLATGLTAIASMTASAEAGTAQAQVQSAAMLAQVQQSNTGQQLAAEARTRSALSSKLDEVIMALHGQGNAATTANAIVEGLQTADF